MDDKNHEDWNKSYLKEYEERKRLYNEVIELKGNIRVFCRCRPLNQTEVTNKSTSVVDIPPSQDHELNVTCADSSVKQFKFDHVFGPETNQGDVLARTLPFVTSVLDGYSVCIFAYGQTGTGKTFTMEGTPENRGVKYRMLEELFNIADQRRIAMRYELCVSMLEVYNETITDLLVKSTHEPSKILNLTQSSEDTQEIPRLVEVRVFDMKEVLELQEIPRFKSAGSTNANELSSRSHSLLRVIVKGKNLLNGQTTKSNLWLVDLAGSERPGKSEVDSESRPESLVINKSLSALGNVISAIASKKSDVSYRNSKLTHMLERSLGGDCKTLMFVHISPADTDLWETLDSLNFARLVKGVDHGPACNKDLSGPSPLTPGALYTEIQKTFEGLMAPDNGSSYRKKPQMTKNNSCRKSEDLEEWYSKVVVKAELIHYVDISRNYIPRPTSMAIWETLKDFLDDKMKKMKIEPWHFPFLLNDKKDVPKVECVTKFGESDLVDPIAIRSAKIFSFFSKSVGEYGDLPLRFNQWCNVVRLVNNPIPFLRCPELFWQEGHGVFATEVEAHDEVLKILDLYREAFEEYLAVPVFESEIKTSDDYYTSVEAFIPNAGFGVGATARCKKVSKKGGVEMVWQNSWAYSICTIGAMVMTHGDDNGLVLPPKVAKVQIIVVPSTTKDPGLKEKIHNACVKTVEILNVNQFRAETDLSNKPYGSKYQNWEMKGVPLLIEIGQSELSNKQVYVVRRDNSRKMHIREADLLGEVEDLLVQIQKNMFDVATKKRDECIKVVATWEEFDCALLKKKIVLAPWCGDEDVEKLVEELTMGAFGAAKILCTPKDQPELKEGTRCFASQKLAKKWTYWGRRY